MGSSGFDRRTGRVLRGWDHVVQSVFLILASRVGLRVMRRSFGCGATSLLGKRFTPQVAALYRLLVVLALERWEPRVAVRRVALVGDVDGVRAGSVRSVISVDYLPDGHRGDRTVASTRDIEI